MHKLYWSILVPGQHLALWQCTMYCYTQLQQFFSNIWVWVDNSLKFALLKNKCEQDYSFYFVLDKSDERVDVLCTLDSKRLVKWSCIASCKSCKLVWLEKLRFEIWCHRLTTQVIFDVTGWCHFEIWCFDVTLKFDVTGWPHKYPCLIFPWLIS